MFRAASTLVARGLRERGLFCLAPQNIVEFAAVATRGRLAKPALSAGKAAEMSETLFKSRKMGKIYAARGTVLRAVREGGELGLVGPAWYDMFLAMTMKDAGVKAIVTENRRDFTGIRGITVFGIAEAAGLLE